MPIDSTKRIFTRNNVDEYAPDAIGVYGLYDLSEHPIYYGRGATDTSTIKNRLLDHVRGDEGECTQSAFYFNWEETSYPYTREKELLEKYKNEHGELPKCNEVMP